MSEGPLPKNWSDAIGQFVWGVLILGWGLELIISILDRQWARAFFALAGGVVFLAMLVHADQLRNRLMAINPNWIVAAAFVCLLALILSPFVEEKRWPFSTWFQTSTHAPSADEIAAAVVKALPQGSQNATFNEATPKPRTPPRSKQEINELLEESGAIQKIVNEGAPLIAEWRETITTQNPERICLDIDPQSLQSKIAGLTTKLNNAQSDLTALYDKNRLERNGSSLNRLRIPKSEGF
jgi:hypothetical protein